MRDTAEPRSSRRTSPRLGGEWLRIAVMGAVLAALLFVTFFYAPSTGAPTAAPAVNEAWDSTPVPLLDDEILAAVRDDVRSARLRIEPAALEHLLTTSLAVTPSVARKLGMSDQPLDIDRLRRNAADRRGNYVWAKGRLTYLSKPKPHPVVDYQHYEVCIETVDGDSVLGAVSLLPDPLPEVGDWVRLEGYFLKLRDTYLPVELDAAPVLVGPELFAAYPDWEAVEQLDRAVLDRVKDGGFAGGEVTIGPDMNLLLAESQDVPLWHLASYATRRAAAPDADAVWAQVPAFASKDQFEQFRQAKVAKGTPLRILGTFVQGRTMPAQVNPLEIGAWTEVWLQVRDLGGKTIPIWIPKRIDQNWRENQAAVVRGYFYKRYMYEAVSGDVRWTPLFVAADVERFELSGDALSNEITAGFAVLVGLVVVVFFFMNRRDRRQRALHEAELVERRRKRRSGAVAAAAP